MPETAIQLQLSAPKGQFTQVTIPRPIPGPDEICIRTKAVALNPLDAKQYAHGLLVQSWPAILGIDASGIVESVGESIQHLRPGDEVFGFCGMGNRSAAFQEVITANSMYMAKKPERLSFEEAVSLPYVVWVYCKYASLIGSEFAISPLLLQSQSVYRCLYLI